MYGHPRESTWRILAPLLICLVGAIAYSNTFTVPFVLDDIVRIEENPDIRTAWPPSVAMATSNRPFAIYTFALNYAIHGYQLGGYHATNLAIHLAVALVLFGLVRRSLIRCSPLLQDSARPLALACTLVWAVHPLQTQAVTYTVQRLELLMGLSYLATLYCFVRAQDSQRPLLWYAASVAACAFGMGCKEVIVSAPLIVLWYDRAFIANSWHEIVSKRKLYYAGLVASWGVLAWSALHWQEEYGNGDLISVPGLTPWTYLISQAGVIVHYLRLSVWPSGQCFDPAWVVAKSPMEVLPQLMAVVAMFAATIGCIFYQPKWSFLGGWFFFVLGPTSSVLPIKDLAFEHRMYLPLAAVVVFVLVGGYMVLAHRVATTRRSRWALAGLVGAVVLSLGIATYLRNATYATRISLWQDTLEKAPHNPRAWVNLGSAYLLADQYEDAKKYLLRGLELDPQDSTANTNYGCALIHTGDVEQGRRYLENTLRFKPHHGPALSNLGHLALDAGDFGNAISYYQQALATRPHDLAVQTNLAAALIGEGRFSDAEKLCRAVVQTDPNSLDANINLASALGAMGRNDAALKFARAAVAIDSKNARAQATLALVLRSIDPQLAREHLTMAVQLEPSSPEYQLALGNLLAPEDPRAAIPFFLAAIELQPNLPQAHFNLALALVQNGQPENAIAHFEKAVSLAPGWAEPLDQLRKLRGTSNP